MNLENQTFYNLEQRERVVYITSEVIIVLESLDPLLLLVVEPRGLVATLFVLLWPPSIAVGPSFTPDYTLVIYPEYSWVVHSLVHIFSF
jgi:hypothetical protein